MTTASPPSPHRRLRPRGEAGPQRTTTVELFFDLVYVFAITQLSHLILDDLTVVAVAQAAFLLVVVWWAWIYTTWMANWFDPDSPVVRTVLTGAMLASLLMAAALPGAFGDQGLLFAASYVALQVGRNAAAMTMLARDHRLRDVFERLVAWSVVSGALWVAGAALEPDQRLLVWIPALGLELVAPFAGYWLPVRGRASTTDWDVEGSHFAERCQLFVIIALGESIVVTGAVAANAGLTSIVVACLVVAFFETVALWWLYFGGPTERSHAAVAASDDPGRLARDAYTYFHLLIVAGIIATAAADGLLIAGPHDSPHGVGTAVVLGGPALFLFGASLFQWRTVGTVNAKRLAAAVAIIALAPLAHSISILALTGIVTVLLTAVAVWELRAMARRGSPAGRARIGSNRWLTRLSWERTIK
jgi:low temperature requirement protein LtrA